MIRYEPQDVLLPAQTRIRGDNFHGVPVGQDNNKRCWRRGKLGFHAAVSIALYHFLDPGTVAFDKLQTIKDIRNHRIAGLRYAPFNVSQGKPLYQPAQRDELHSVIIDIDDDTARIVIVPMHYGVQQRLTHRFPWVVGMVDPPQAIKGGTQVVILHSWKESNWKKRIV